MFNKMVKNPIKSNPSVFTATDIYQDHSIGQNRFQVPIGFVVEFSQVQVFKLVMEFTERTPSVSDNWGS